MNMWLFTHWINFLLCNESVSPRLQYFLKNVALRAKSLPTPELSNEEENYQQADVIKIVNAIQNSPKKSREFDELVI